MSDATTWTPGPWFAHRAMRGWATGICISRKAAAEAAETIGDCPIATVQEGAAHWDTKYPVEANAHLIAAAPALYEALAALLESHAQLVNSGDCGFWDVEEEAPVKLARAALAAARPNKEG